MKGQLRPSAQVVLFLRTVVIVAAVYSGLLLIAPPAYTNEVNLTCDGGDTIEGTFQSRDECTAAMGSRFCGCGLRTHPFYFAFYLLLLPLALAGAAISGGSTGTVRRILALACGVVVAGGVHIFRFVATNPPDPPEAPFVMAIALIALVLLSTTMLVLMAMLRRWTLRERRVLP
jgi:hypothetical protein